MSNFIENDDVIYSAGAQIQQMKLANGKYAWVVVAFEELSYYDGGEVSLNALHQEKQEHLFNIIGYQLISKKSGKPCKELHHNNHVIFENKEDLTSALNQKDNPENWFIREVRSNELNDPEILELNKVIAEKDDKNPS